MKIFFVAIVLFGVSEINVFAQNVGINATGNAPNASAGLDVDYANKGMLIPRVALTQTTSNLPIGASVVTSLLVYNTATVSDVTPGYYYWNGSKWVQLLTTTSGCTSCTMAGWTLVAVANSTVANNGGFYASGYTVAPGKEVLVITLATGGDVTVSTADNVTLAEYTASAFTFIPGGAKYFFVDSPIGTSASGGGGGGTCHSAKILGRTLNAGATPALITPNTTVGIGLSGNGALWIWDTTNGSDVSMYIFER